MALLTRDMSCTIAERVVFFPWTESTGTRVVGLPEKDCHDLDTVSGSTCFWTDAL